MEKLANVLKAVITCHDENCKCSECPYNDSCALENEGSRMLADARELYTELLSGSLARRIVEEAQSDGMSDDVFESAYRNEPAKHLTCEDVEDCINLLDEIRSILVSGKVEDEPENQVSFTNDMMW